MKSLGFELAEEDASPEIAEENPDSPVSPEEIDAPDVEADAGGGFRDAPRYPARDARNFGESRCR